MVSKLFVYSFAILLLGIGDLSVNGTPSPVILQQRSPTLKSHDGVPMRKMIAARAPVPIKPRQLSLGDFLRTEHVLPFFEDNDLTLMEDATESRQRTPFAAHVQLKSSLPTLLLEEHEGFLDSIACSRALLELTFHDSNALLTAWEAIQKHPEILVITSHFGCNAEGERNPLVASAASKTDHVLTFSTVSTTFKKSFSTINMHFGTHDVNAALVRHDQHLKKRQDAPITTTQAPGTSVQFPPVPSSSPTNTKVAGASITTAWLGATVLPPSFPGSDIARIPDFPAGLNVVCKNCSVQGSVDLSHGLITASNSSNASSDEDEGILDVLAGNIDEIVEFYQSGYLELTVNDFFAHIELESTVKPSTSLASWTAPFPDIGIPGWVIPKIAEVGPILRPQLTFGVELSTDLDFTYGFELRIPNNSTVHIDINDPLTNSTVTGFQNTNFTALPFQSRMNSLNLTVSAAFIPQLLLTLNVFDDAAELSAGAFLDLPKLSATVAQVKNVDDNCNPTNGSNKDKGFFDNSLTNIVPKVDLGLGVLAQGKIDVEVYETDIGATTTLASTEYALPTACISYDGKAKTYAAVGAAATKKGAAAEGAHNPFCGMSKLRGGFAFVLALGWAAYLM